MPNLQNGGDELPKRICKYIGCNKLIDKSQVYCEKHQKKIEERKKENYKFYDYSRKDSKEWSFYKTKKWEKLREDFLNQYFYIDVYIYYTEKRIVKANTVHHIVEVREDWDRRLDIDNLFPLSDGTHTKVHKMYERDKEGTQDILRALLNKFKSEVLLEKMQSPPR